MSDVTFDPFHEIILEDAIVINPEDCHTKQQAFKAGRVNGILETSGLQSCLKKLATNGRLRNLKSVLKVSISDINLMQIHNEWVRDFLH